MNIAMRKSEVRVLIAALTVWVILYFYKGERAASFVAYAVIYAAWCMVVVVASVFRIVYGVNLFETTARAWLHVVGLIAYAALGFTYLGPLIVVMGTIASVIGGVGTALLIIKRR